MYAWMCHAILGVAVHLRVLAFLARITGVYRVSTAFDAVPSLSQFFAWWLYTMVLCEVTAMWWCRASSIRSQAFVATLWLGAASASLADAQVIMTGTLDGPNSKRAFIRARVSAINHLIDYLKPSNRREWCEFLLDAWRRIPERMHINDKGDLEYRPVQDEPPNSVDAPDSVPDSAFDSVPE